jgi:hypothetical protein
MHIIINNKEETFLSLIRGIFYNKFIIFELFKKDLKTSYVIRVTQDAHKEWAHRINIRNLIVDFVVEFDFG